MKGSRESSHEAVILKSLNDFGFWVFYEVLKTEEHGIPQHRDRLYVVAIKRECYGIGPNTIFPTPLPHCLSASSLLHRKNAAKVEHVSPSNSKSAHKRIQETLEDLKKNGIKEDDCCFIDLDASDRFSQWQKDSIPCLTHSRAAAGGYYITSRKRRMSIVCPTIVEAFVVVVIQLCISRSFAQRERQLTTSFDEFAKPLSKFRRVWQAYRRRVSTSFTFEVDECEEQKDIQGFHSWTCNVHGRDVQVPRVSRR